MLVVFVKVKAEIATSFFGSKGEFSVANIHSGHIVNQRHIKVVVAIQAGAPTNLLTRRPFHFRHGFAIGARDARKVVGKMCFAVEAKPSNAVILALRQIDNELWNKGPSESIGRRNGIVKNNITCAEARIGDTNVAHRRASRHILHHGIDAGGIGIGATIGHRHPFGRPVFMPLELEHRQQAVNIYFPRIDDNMTEHSIVIIVGFIDEWFPTCVLLIQWEGYSADNGRGDHPTLLSLRQVETDKEFLAGLKFHGRNTQFHRLHSPTLDGYRQVAASDAGA